MVVFGGSNEASKGQMIGSGECLLRQSEKLEINHIFGWRDSSSDGLGCRPATWRISVKMRCQKTEKLNAS